MFKCCRFEDCVSSTSFLAHAVLPMSNFEAELNALAASASVASTPHIKGGSTIEEISNRGYTSDDSRSQKGEIDEGKYKIDIDTLPGGNDKNLHEVCLVDDLAKKDPSGLCRQKRSGGKMPSA